MNAPSFDTGTLSWVKDEIDLALERAGSELARHAAAPADSGPLEAARAHLHQACGALTLVGLAGVSHFAATLEARLAELSVREGGDVVAVDAAAGAALSALRRYLDDLMAGHPDQPLRLFSAYRALALAAGLPAPSPVALFYPDLTQRPPRRENTATPPTPLTPVRLKALRLGFARGLSKWRAGEARGLIEIRNALAIIEQGCIEPTERALWWVALAYCDAQPAPDPDLLAALEAQLTALADGASQGNTGAETAPAALMSGLLYGIAVAPPGGDHVEYVRAAYRLADLIPPGDTGVETRREACRAPLVTAMEEWERFSAGAAIALMRFHDVALLLAASAHDSRDDELARLAQAIADFAAWLRQQPERADRAMALEVAGALVLVEDAIEQEGTRSPTDETLFAAEVAGQIARLDMIRVTGTASTQALPHQRWREHLMIGQVAKEIRVNLDAIEPTLDAYFESPTEMGQMQIARDRLHQITGAFQLLDEGEAARVAAATEARLAACLEQTATREAFDAIASRLTVLGQFADSLVRSQPDRTLWQTLDPDRAEACAPTESASPLPLPADAEPAPAAPAGASAGGDDELLTIFTEEAHDVLSALAAAQPALAADPADRDALTTLRRGFHTLKGSGRMVGLVDLGEAAFALEKLLNRWLDERNPVPAEMQRLIDDARRCFVQWVAAIENKQAAPDPADLLRRCEEMQAGSQPKAVPAEEPVPAAISPAPPVPTPEPIKEIVTVGAHDISATLYRLYVEEAQGHVVVLRKELSGPATVPSRDLIRAAHTLAGISGSTGFPPVQMLAHALENALVRHSLARVAPDEGGRMLLARAVGALEGMVGAIAERRAPSDESSLSESLASLRTPQADIPAPTATQISPLAERRQSRPADEIDLQLAALFLEEADDQLRQLEEDLRTWRTAPHQANLGRRMARLLHTFKGSARMCGAMGLGELAHGMETRIEQAMREGIATPTALDEIDASLGRAGHLIVELRARVAPAAIPAPVLQVSAPLAAPAGEPGPAVLLRVRADLIDHLVNEAGEMAIARSRIESSLKSFKGALIDLTENVARLRSQLREFEIHAETSMQAQHGSSEAHRRDFDPLEFDRFTRLQELTRMMAESVGDVATVQNVLVRQVDDANEAAANQSRHNREISHALLRARMVPFTTVAERLHRVVRQTAKELDRQANLDIRGGDTPVDRSVLERMLGPLEHLLRNAVAHGIESADKRRAAGKPEIGQITLSITPADNDIALVLADDGGGLDFAAIRRRAIERGLLAHDAETGDEALAELIFRPGFSTAARVSEIAGRGVGLDVVKNEVAQLGGRVEVSAGTGQGTRFEIVLPLTLAVIPVMLVKAAGQHWAIPATMVEEAREISAAELAALHAAGGVQRGSKRYPWHTLPELFGMTQHPSAEPGRWQILLKSGNNQIALEVDAMTQNQEVVVKPLGDQLARVPGLTGATVLPDGSVALIANPVTLAVRTSPLSVAPMPSPVVAATGGVSAVPAIPTIMVVDDSLTVRKITGRLLERAGYRVITAKDGVDALERLEETMPDVMLADIEMPRMDGFELVRAVRAKPRLAALPVIMITSRIADKHRQIAASIGVQHYLGKPYDETELLGLIAAQIGR